MDEIVHFVLSYPVVSVVAAAAFVLTVFEIVEIALWKAGFNVGYQLRWSNISIIIDLWLVAFTLYINQYLSAYILIGIIVVLVVIATRQNTVSILKTNSTEKKAGKNRNARK